MQTSIDPGIQGRRRALRAPLPTGLVLVASLDARVEDSLRRERHEVATVTDGEALLRNLEDPVLSHAIDVVVAEIALPRRSALDVLAELRDRVIPPVVLLSPFGSRALNEEARRAGAFVLLREPVLPGHLRAVVATLLRRSAAS
jgi:DNA-binding response OmpR family regulator